MVSLAFGSCGIYNSLLVNMNKLLLFQFIPLCFQIFELSDSSEPLSLSNFYILFIICKTPDIFIKFHILGLFKYLRIIYCCFLFLICFLLCSSLFCNF